MNKTLPLNVMNCIDKIYERMNDNYNFAYPDGRFDEHRAHPILSRFGTFHATLNTLFDKDYMIPSNEVEKIFFKQMLGNAKTIGLDKDWAYPNNILAENRTSTALNCIDSSMKNYHNSIKLLGNYCFSDKQANFDLLGFIENISCLNAYNYAYPKNYYNPDKAHTAIQMLLCITENVTYILSSVVTPDEEVNNIVSNYVNKLSSAKKTLLKSYPDNQFNKDLGHDCLSKFIETWKNAKAVFVPNLKNYFEKQELVAEYEAKLNKKEDKLVTFPQYPHFEELMNSGNSMTATPPVDNVAESNIVEKKPEVVEELSSPVVKKIKSML